MKYSIGADPELFVRNVETGKLISAHDLLPGSKHTPFPVPHGAVQPDGVAAEFNIEPANDHLQFTDNILTVVNELTRMVRVRSPNYDLVAIPTANFSAEYFDKLPMSAKALGCEPDYQAWSTPAGKENSIGEGAIDRPFRTGAGHIHIGWRDDGDPFDAFHWSKCIDVVKQLDTALYIPSLLWDSDDKRRTLYGRMGSFRPKSYGVEYRPLSNAFVLQPQLHKFIFNTTQRAMELLDQEVHLWDAPIFASRLRQINAGLEPDIDDIREHYFELLCDDWCEVLPDELLTDSYSVGDYGDV